MRYVRDKLVLRLSAGVSGDLLEAINLRFSDILTGGCFTMSGPLAEERDEPELANLARLVFRFNRRDFGRLRRLIDCVNRGKVEEA
jgi:hypothetical protein